MWWLYRAVRRRIAIKLTLTLVGFVGLSLLAAGLYLDRALEAFAVESLAARLLSLGAVLNADAGALLRAGADLGDAQAFVTRAARAAGGKERVR